MERDQALQDFVDAAEAAFKAKAATEASRRSLDALFADLRTPKPLNPAPPERLPVCRWIEPALAAGFGDPLLARLADRFAAIEPRLVWTRRERFDETASPGFPDGHANAVILGPGGLEERTDLMLGLSLMAPGVRYPDHTHAPEETYLVLSESEFHQEKNDWFRPGIGGSFYNRPGIVHAMRSLDTPLFAFWALREA